MWSAVGTASLPSLVGIVWAGLKALLQITGGIGRKRPPAAQNPRNPGSWSHSRIPHCNTVGTNAQRPESLRRQWLTLHSEQKLQSNQRFPFSCSAGVMFRWLPYARFPANRMRDQREIVSGADSTPLVVPLPRSTFGLQAAIEPAAPCLAILASARRHAGLSIAMSHPNRCSGPLPVHRSAEATKQGKEFS